MSLKRAARRGIVVALPLVLIALIALILDDTPTLIQEPASAAASGPVQALFRIEAEAARAGWTPERHVQAGDLRREMGDLAGAVAHWEAAGGQVDRLATAYLTLQRWPEAVAALKQQAASNPDNAWLDYQLGIIQAGVNPMAAEPYLQAVLRVPDYAQVAVELLNAIQSEPPVNMQVGMVLAAHDLWPQAELAFTQAAALDYPYPEAMAYVALARRSQGKSADTWMAQALALGAAVPPVHYLHGLHLRASGLYEESLDALRVAVQLDPENPAYYAELGAAYRLLFDYTQAEYWLRMALTVSDEDLVFQTMLATFYAEEGYHLTQESLDFMQAMGEDLPADPVLFAGYGWALYSLGDVAGGEQAIDAALSMAPEDPTALYYKARFLLDQDRQDEALPYVRSLARLDSPYRDWAQSELERAG